MKKVSIVLALTMVFVLAMAATALAAAPSGTPISDPLILEATSGEAEEPTIFVNEDLAEVAAKGMYDLFSVGTTPGDAGNTMVRVKAECTEGGTDGFTLEYLEQDSNNDNYGKYLTLPFDNEGVAWFGPSGGFPLKLVTDSKFRVTWKEAGTYGFTLSIVDMEGNTLASNTASVTVIDAMPLVLSWKDGKPGGTFTVGKDFDIGVTAALYSDSDGNKVSHVDNTLFVIEVQKGGEGEWAAASADDFEITAVNGEDTEGINKTFSVVDDKLQGYWGPPTGFTFVGEDNGSTTTTMTSKFNKTGEYKVTIYAIQVAPADKAD